MKAALGVTILMLLFCVMMVFVAHKREEPFKYIISVYDYNYKSDKDGNLIDKPSKLYMFNGNIKIKRINDSFISVEFDNKTLIINQGFIEIEKTKGE
jgi:hypothetical protein